MRAKSHSSRPFKNWAVTDDLLQNLVGWVASVLIAIGSAVISLVLGFYSTPKPATDLLSLVQRSSFFVLGLGVFAVVIVVIGIILKHKARDVRVLKNQLAAIYLTALNDSALNPQRQRSARLSRTLTIQE